MPDLITPNLGLTKPTVGLDVATWGAIVNTDLDLIDTNAGTSATNIAAKANKAGDTLTGLLYEKTEAMFHNAIAGTSGAVAIDLSLGNVASITVAGAMTLSITNPPASTPALIGLLLRITNGGSAAITWFTGSGGAQIKYPGGIGVGKPTLTAAGTDFLAFISFDAGLTWSLSGVQLDEKP